MQVTNHFEMPTARSQVPGGLPQLPWQGANASSAQRSTAALAREARAAERREANKATVDANKAALDVNRDPEAKAHGPNEAALGDRNKVGPKEPDPCD